MSHPMKHYEELRRAWKRLHVASGAIVKAFDDGDLANVDLHTKLVTEALEDIAEAAGKFAKATDDSER